MSQCGTGIYGAINNSPGEQDDLNMMEILNDELQMCDPPAGIRELTILLVEDDLLSMEMSLMHLKGFFTHIITASDGNEGFRLFCEQTPDIVLTDQIMPDVSGLDLMRRIRATGSKTPVVLMTSSIDNEILLEAINTGVERFVPKPFQPDALIRALDSIAREIINKRLLEGHRQQEVELLRHQDNYNSMQQESARRKERHVIRHDLRDQVLEGAGGTRWGIDVSYSPRDIMCGDGYSVRSLFDGRQLFFVVDAMGSGMSASLTAMLTTSFLNYQVENLHLWETFSLRLFLKRFQEYLSGMLLEEEVLSCGFFLVDLEREEIETALFALPPLLIRGVDGTVRRIRGENPPLGVYTSEIRVGNLSLSGVYDLLVMTDGISDALLANGGPYREELENDFRMSPTIAALRRRFRKKTNPEAPDDLTLIHLQRLDFNSGWSWRSGAEVTPSGLAGMTEDFLDALAKEVFLDSVERDELGDSLTEALTIALEHGRSTSGRNEKIVLQREDASFDANEQKTSLPEAAAALSASLWRGAGRPLLLLEVRINGDLPDDARDADADETSGNIGPLQKMRRFSDLVFVDKSRRRLIILKVLEEGDAHAD